MMTESLDYHLLGAPILVLFGVIAGVSALPRRRRSAVREFLNAHRTTTWTAYALFVGVFLVHGIARAVFVLAADRSWP